ncbi:GNAT family N-acetyltransferase [Rhodoblastus acidophilus]|uniref:GNAT family N-acetyltransferase n=1 Tax=Rhodoblastus acidophilus TaxID=1074 RepID=A0A6N8DNL4_RHOAC|nr:GNAT family N-acetyltransferase [Rhodoblastus acidophilus]MCW2275643.1 RimJ/RimL family protein N-acetyltransferase [Rhodoblastus acidophilus]MTV32140.1 GNAT family N-acetyltransferase [Rhodoblastus acidophilus]
MFPDLARDDVFRLETRRLWLRWPQASDAPVLAALAGDWEVARLTAYIPHPYGLEDAAGFVRDSRCGNSAGHHLRLVMTRKGGDRSPIGMIGLEPCADGFNLGYWLGRAHWRHGFAAEAAGAMIDAFFLVTKAHALTAAALPENAASQAVLRRIGFQPVGEAPAPGRHAGAKALLFALDRESWARAA